MLSYEFTDLHGRRTSSIDLPNRSRNDQYEIGSNIENAPLKQLLNLTFRSCFPLGPRTSFKVGLPAARQRRETIPNGFTRRQTPFGSTRIARAPPPPLPPQVRQGAFSPAEAAMLPSEVPSFLHSERRAVRARRSSRSSRAAGGSVHVCQLWSGVTCVWYAVVLTVGGTRRTRVKKLLHGDCKTTTRLQGGKKQPLIKGSLHSVLLCINGVIPSDRPTTHEWTVILAVEATSSDLGKHVHTACC